MASASRSAAHRQTARPQPHDREPDDRTENFREAQPIKTAPGSAEPPVHPSPRSLRGLDWFIFFVADVQTGFGPFVSVYLTTQKWTQVDIGVVLSIGGIIALLAQMPGGAVVDAARSERLVAGAALCVISASALAYAAWPIFPVVLGAAAMHAAASCVLGPCIVALSLGLVGHAALGERLGRNARFAAMGNGMAAAAMGTVGYLFAPRAVFFVTAALLIPTLIALYKIRSTEVDPTRAHGGIPQVPPDRHLTDLPGLLSKRPLLILAGCVMLFHLANAAMLPLMGSVMTMRSSESAPMLIAACIIVPQVIVAVIAPWVGRQALVWGSRTFLLLAFAALILRALLFAAVTNSYLIVVIQVLDGITAASIGVMVPLIVADLTRGTGRFNFSQGVVGTFVGIGGSMSPTLAGYLTDHFGGHIAFLGLAAIAAAGFCAVWALMPQTRPQRA
jgi:predicted MFS family arabinose efflux permease